jgi:hypothetical protein
MDSALQAFKKYRTIIIIGFFLLILAILSYKFDWYTQEYRDLTPEESVEVTRMRKDAYDYAVSCSKTEKPALKFEQIQWILMPGDYLDVRAIDGRIKLKGYYNQTDSTIYLPFTERNTKWLAAHEALHAIGYFADENGKHPNFPFRSCGLLREQN